MKKILSIALLASIVLAACKEKNPIVPPPAATDPYIAIKQQIIQNHVANA